MKTLVMLVIISVCFVSSRQSLSLVSVWSRSGLSLVSVSVWSRSGLGLVSVSIMLYGLQKVLVQLVGAVSATTLVCETHM